LALDSVVCIFVVLAEFDCRHTKQGSLNQPFRFQVHLCQCGDPSSVHVKWSQNSQQLIAST
jgi:hypothetical protein